MADLSTPTHDGQSEQTAESLITMTAKDGGNVASSEYFGAGAIIDHIDIWTTAIEQKSTAGRGSSNKFSLYGIKKLRELILELAVRGKLVPHDANDEPASVLLKRIAAEKAQLVKEGKLKKQKPLPEISEDEKPFELPHGWEWSRLGEYAEVKGGKRLPKGHTLISDQTEYAYIRVTDMKDGSVNLHGLQYLTADTQKLIQQYTISKNDLYITIAGTIGEVGSIPEELDGMNLTENAAKIVFNQIDRLWLKKSLSANFSMSQFIEKVNQLAQPKLALHRILSSILPVPPLEEQHRIVAKVDELMSLCDALEAQTEVSISAHQTLVETLLNALLQPNTTQPADSQSASLESALNDSFADSWDRVAEHFDTLFTTEASIDTLKQTILQLAVMGKLVPQDDNDEPAAKLLERIKAEKAQLIKDGKIKKQKPLPAITDEEKPFELPNGWEWCRLGTLYSFLNGFAFKSEWFQPEGIKLLRNINIAHSETKWGDQACIPSSMAAEYEKYLLSAGDIVISLDRPIINTGLKYAVIEQSDLPCLLLQRVAKFHSHADTVTPKYLSRWLESDLFMSAIDPGRSNGVPHISTKQLEAMVFPLCSLEEQHRIVAKVDELMALCDQLKARLSDAQTTQLHLTDAIVEQVV